MRSNTSMLARQAFDANSSFHLPLPRRVGPYLVQRFITNITVVPSATDITVFIIGPVTALSTGAGQQNSYTSVCGVSGLGAATLAVGAPIAVADLTNLGNGTNGNFAEMTVSAMSTNLLCTASNVGGGGLIWMGRTSSTVDFGSTATTFSSMVGAFIGRNDVKPISWYSLFSPRDVHSIPLDIVAFEQFLPIQNIAFNPAFQAIEHGLSPIIIIFSAVAAAASVSYNLRIAVEARVRYPIGNPLSSAHMQHQPVDSGVWNEITTIAGDVIGGVEDVALGGLGAMIVGAPNRAAPSFGGGARAARTWRAARALV